jgi:hypothetical protein
VPFKIEADESAKEFEVTLVPDNFRRTEKVEVTGDIFQRADSPALIETNLTSSAIRDTSTVLGDDPFRAVQALPGVSAAGNNDFFAQFSVLGTPYDDVSTYIDGILITQPFHGITDLAQGATLSLLSSETIEDVKLLPVAIQSNMAMRLVRHSKFGLATAVARRRFSGSRSLWQTRNCWEKGNLGTAGEDRGWPLGAKAISVVSCAIG